MTKELEGDELGRTGMVGEAQVFERKTPDGSTGDARQYADTVAALPG